MANVLPEVRQAPVLERLWGPCRLAPHFLDKIQRYIQSLQSGAPSDATAPASVTLACYFGRCHQKPQLNMLRHVRSLLPAACLLTQGASVPLRALATQASSLPSLASFGGLFQQQQGSTSLVTDLATTRLAAGACLANKLASLPSPKLTSTYATFAGPSRLPQQQQHTREPLLLGQHALLPQVARAVAELQATKSMLVPHLDLGLTVEGRATSFSARVQATPLSRLYGS